MDPREKLQHLLDKSEWTADDNKKVLDYLESNLDSDQRIPELTELLRQRFEQNLKITAPADRQTAARILKNIHAQIEVEQTLAAESESAYSSTYPKAQTKTYKISWLKWAAAASVIVIGSLVFKYSNRATPPTNTTNQIATITPGGNRAILTLANGANIILDSVQNGTIAQQGTTQITKLGNGELAYNTSEKPANESGNPSRNETSNPTTEISYNVLNTPRGGQYQLTLPDGTKVWLNAASSIKYPTAFTGVTRNVEIRGEAYFEVAHNAAMPFHVKTGTMDVTVLGTRFNVMSYPEEAVIRTTLLEGSVRITDGKSSGVLKPDQEAVIARENGTLSIRAADAEQAVAWKNGRFEFNGNIQTIMRQIARWYDVDVSYEGDVAGKSFGGAISRKENVSEVLKMLELTGSIHFRIEGRKITVISGK